MIADKRNELIVALILIAPAIIIFCLIFIYPTAQMVVLSFTNAPLIGAGAWVGFDNYVSTLTSPIFGQSLFNTMYFVVLTVIPGTLLALLIALGVNRLKGWQQGFALACFFLPSILPVSVIVMIWDWMGNIQYGVLQTVIVHLGGHKTPLYRSQATFMPMVAVITLWWSVGFNILLFIAALRNVSPDIYEAAALDNAGRWRVFTRVTWPLIWPVTALVLTLGLIAQIKIFSQAYLLGYNNGSRPEAQTTLMKLVYDLAFTQNKGGAAQAVAVLVFLIIIVLSVLQFQFLTVREKR